MAVDRIDHARGDFLEGDEAALGAVFCLQRGGGDELGLELVAPGGADAVLRGDGGDVPGPVVAMVGAVRREVGLGGRA